MTVHRLACLHSGSERSAAGHAEIAARYPLVEPDAAEAIVVLGGDGFLLRSLHAWQHLGVPFFGMNRGTLGFLMNAYRCDHLPARIAAAKAYDLRPLATTVTTEDGEVVDARAFNEVAVMRDTGQSANIRIEIDGVVRVGHFVGDGLLVSTSAGSTAYNASAGGPIIPLGLDTLALTPVCPFRPRGWRGALLPHSVEIAFDNLDPGKRPLLATADFRQIRNAIRVTVRDEPQARARLLFEHDHSLEERIVREQFGG